MTQITALERRRRILTLMSGMVAAYLLAARRPATAMFVIGAVAGGAILGSILKDVFERPRPGLVPPTSSRCRACRELPERPRHELYCDSTAHSGCCSQRRNSVEPLKSPSI